MDALNTQINPNKDSYAVSEEEITPQVYSITYNLNNGNGDTILEEYSEEDLPIILKNPSREGYIFWGWYNNDQLTGLPTGIIPKGSTGDKEFWAKWEEYVVSEDDKIATNKKINEASKNIYEFNDNKCPTKSTLLNSTEAYNCTSVKGSYSDTECVKFSDISFHRTIKFTLKNNIGTDIDHSSTIYFANKDSSNVITIFASYYVEPNQITKDYNKSHEIVLDVNELGNYTDQTLVVGFNSNWISRRRLVFTINGKDYEIPESTSGSNQTDISTVQFLRSYYEGITINIYRN